MVDITNNNRQVSILVPDGSTYESVLPKTSASAVATSTANKSVQDHIDDTSIHNSSTAIGTMISTALADYTPTSSLSTVATSGSYNDLSNKPTIGSATVTIQKNGTKVDDFSVNATSNKNINISIPVNVTDLADASSYYTSAQVDEAISTAVTSVYRYKGSVASYSQLPTTGRVAGDVWNVEDTGANYAWTGSAWDKLSDDMTNYVTLNGTQTLKNKTISVSDNTITGLSAVATSGSYNDLSNKPTIGSATYDIKRNNVKLGTINVNATSGSDINITVPTAVTDLSDASDYALNADLASVAKSGSYNDLSNTPTIGSATLTIKKNGTAVDTFSANATTDKDINITVPTKVSDLTNDTGFITGVAWGDVTGKPSTFTPSAHNQASNTINALTDYSKSVSGGTGALATSDTLNKALAKLENALDGKQATISDLATIRSGASAGATALQPNTSITAGTHTKITYDSNGLVTAGADLSASDIPDISATYQTVISDLDTIRSGASAGATALQPNDSITGDTKCKITYDSNGLVTAGDDLIDSDIPDLSSEKISSMTGYDKSAGSNSGVLTSDTLNEAIAKLEHQIDSKQASGSYVPTSRKVNNKALSSDITLSYTDVGAAASSHNHNSGEVTVMTGYSKASSASAITTSDTLNTAIGKLEKGLDGKQATISDLDTIRSGATAGSTAIQPNDNVSSLTNDAGYITGVAWDDVTSKPSTFTPSAHNQASSTINSLSGYNKSVSGGTGAIATSDTLNKALAKLENALDGKQASGSYVPTTRTVNNKALSSDITLSASDVGALADSTFIPTITDTYSATSTDGMSGKAVASAISGKANSATSLSGYGITDAYTKTEIDGKLSGAMHFMGTKASVSALPTTGNTQGDMWNVTDTGANYAWDGSAWDKLSENIDLSGYVPTTRKVNDKALSGDITLSYTDVGAAASSHNHTTADVTALTGYTIASSASAISASDSLNTALGKIQKSLDGKQASGSYVTTSRKINNKALSSDITLSASDVGALPDSTVIPTITDTYSATSTDGMSGKAVASAISGKQNTISDLDTIRSGATAGSTAIQPNDNVSSLTNDAGYITGVAWDDVTSKPSTFTPSAHNQASNTINVLTGYDKTSGTATAISASDSLNVALAKIEQVLDTKQGGGSYVPTSRKVNNKALSSDITLTASDVGALPDSTVIPSVVDTYSATGTDAVSGKGVKAALDTLTIPTTTSSVTSGSTAALTSGGAYTNLVRRLSTSAATGGANQGVYIDANGQVQTCNATTSTYSATGTTAVNGTAVASAISGKQNTISDLSTIRSGAEAGATALQPNDPITGATKCKITYDSKGLVTAGADLSASDIPDISATYQTVISDLSDIRSGASAGATALQPNDNVSSLTNDAGYITGVAWGDVTGKPDSFTPSTHNQASSTINSMTGYVKSAGSNTAVAVADTLNEAIAKLEHQIDSKQASGSYVTTSRKINDKALSSDITLTASDVGALPDSTVVPTTTSSVTSGSTAALTSGGAYTNLVRRLSTSAATGSSSQGVYIDANGQVQTCAAVTSTYAADGTAPVNGIAVKSAIDSAISSAYKAAGTVAFANLPSLSASIEGNVYNVSDAFTTTTNFVEGAGKSYPAGTNVVCINTSGSTYKWDVLAGFVDLSSYQLTSTAVTHTASTAVGSATNPVYIASNGTATATTYELNKTVPADAVFTDTTYSAFTGADGSSAGTAGLVIAPAATDNTKFLKGDGSWSAVTIEKATTSTLGTVKPDGTTITVDSAGTISAVQDTMTMVVDEFTMASAGTTITLTSAPASKALCWVNICNTDIVSSEWSLSGNTITLNTAIPADTWGQVRYFTNVGGVTASSPLLNGSATVTSGALTLQASKKYYTATVSANTTFTITAPSTSDVIEFYLHITHTSGTITFPSSVKWVSTPTFTSGKKHLIKMISFDGGTTYLAQLEGSFS